jgi:hypothetical protein
MLGGSCSDLAAACYTAVGYQRAHKNEEFLKFIGCERNIGRIGETT